MNCIIIFIVTINCIKFIALQSIDKLIHCVAPLLFETIWLSGRTIVGRSRQPTKGNQLIVISREILYCYINQLPGCTIVDCLRQIKHSPIINTQCIYDYFKISFIVWNESSLFQLCRIRDISHDFSVVIYLHHYHRWRQEIIIQHPRWLLYNAGITKFKYVVPLSPPSLAQSTFYWQTKVDIFFLRLLYCW